MTRHILFIAIALICGAVEGATPLTDSVVREVRRWRRAEENGRILKGHETVIRLHTDEHDRPIRTKQTALIISGLFNSPKSVRALENEFFRRGLNVINLRLAGHWECDRVALCSGVTWQEWRDQSIAAFRLARRLGGPVVMAGHSTGALLLMWLAVDEPESVAGLALFAPAFDLNSNLIRLLAFEYNLHVQLPWGRLLTLHAGREVQKLGRAFAERIAAEPGGDEWIGERLRSIPVWMGNTNFDTVIDLDRAANVYRAIESGSTARRHHRRLHACNMILHDQLAAPPSWRLNLVRRWRWRGLRKTMGRTLFDD